ncbi:hypothetical protein AC249_AIPGENE3229 [Exaiptasia diaphana]|nr:hypothetical protein AC249_AIPGENE3229 [Exaiptasia diaphana]
MNLGHLLVCVAIIANIASIASTLFVQGGGSGRKRDELTTDTNKDWLNKFQEYKSLLKKIQDLQQTTTTIFASPKTDR